MRGTEVTGEGFKAYLQLNAPLQVGAEAHVEVVLEPQAPFKCNEQYPYRFSNVQGEGINLKTVDIRNADVNPQRTVLVVPVTPSRAGRANVSGTFAFSVCTDEKCLIEKRPLQLAFDVVR